MEYVDPGPCCLQAGPQSWPHLHGEPMEGNTAKKAGRTSSLLSSPSAWTGLSPPRSIGCICMAQE